MNSLNFSATRSTLTSLIEKIKNSGKNTWLWSKKAWKVRGMKLEKFQSNVAIKSYFALLIENFNKLVLLYVFCCFIDLYVFLIFACMQKGKNC